MSIVCWTSETDPVKELYAYTRSFEDDLGDHYFVLSGYELRCSREFHDWMLDLPRLKRALADLPHAVTGWSPHRREFIIAGDVHVTLRENVDVGEAQFFAVLQGELMRRLFTINAIGLTTEPIDLGGQPGTMTRWEGADGRSRWTARSLP